MDKLTIKLCMGTTCYVMGGADLMLLSEKIPEELKNQILIKGSPCIDLCFDQTEKRPPYALVGKQIVSEATVEKIIREIEDQLK